MRAYRGWRQTLRGLVVISVMVGINGVVVAAPASEPATQPASEQLQRLAETVAAQLPWMSQDFLYDRPFLPRQAADADKVQRLWMSLRQPAKPDDAPQHIAANWYLDAALQPGPWSADEIRLLLHHADPKVRTLGIMLMYELNRVDVLPELAPLAYDQTPTFMGPGIPSQVYGQPPPPMRPQSVGTFAKAVIAFYARNSPELSSLFFMLGGNEIVFSPSGKDSPSVPLAELQHRLNAFAAKRDPMLCTAALLVAMERAGGGTSPAPADRRGRIDAILQLSQQQIPMPRRFFVALALGFQERHDERYSAEYLIDLARQVPREMRLKVMREQRPIDDPDLNDFGYRFFADHVVELFRAADADVFLGLARDQTSQADRSHHDQIAAARYHVLAAKLRPGDADAILAKAMKTLTGTESWDDDARASVAVAMADIGGEASLQQAVDCLFAMHPQPSGDGRKWLLGELAAANPARARILYEKLIRDSRLESLGPDSTRFLVQAVEGYLGRPLASEDEIRDSYYSGEVQLNGPFTPLVAWHKALRDTVDEWSR